MERLQKAIAQSGFCSRRKAEEYIIQGKVKVNGKVVDILGSKVKPNDTITINGQALVREDKVYFNVEHAPTKCNFWHFNVLIYGVNSKTHETYRLRDIEGYSNGQMTKVATALIHKLEDKLVLPQDMKKMYLSKSKYLKF